MVQSFDDDAVLDMQECRNLEATARYREVIEGADRGSVRQPRHQQRGEGEGQPGDALHLLLDRSSLHLCVSQPASNL